MAMIFEDFFYDAFLIPQLCEEPNGMQITPLEPNGIILNSGLYEAISYGTRTEFVVLLRDLKPIFYSVNYIYRDIFY